MILSAHETGDGGKFHPVLPEAARVELTSVPGYAIRGVYIPTPRKFDNR